MGGRMRINESAPPFPPLRFHTDPNVAETDPSGRVGNYARKNTLAGTLKQGHMDPLGSAEAENIHSRLFDPPTKQQHISPFGEVTTTGKRL